MATILIKSALFGGDPSYQYENHNSGKITTEDLIAAESRNEIGEYLDNACEDAGWIVGNCKGVENFLAKVNEEKIISLADDCSCAVVAILEAKDGETNEQAHARINTQMNADMDEMMREEDYGGEDYDEDDWTD